MLCKKDALVSNFTEADFSVVGTSLAQSEKKRELKRTHPLCDTSILSSQFRDSMLPSTFLAIFDDDDDLHSIDLISVASPHPSG
jgi:hypothetical protein